jgi:GTPase Era involved in 16S rRNA processing
VLKAVGSAVREQLAPGAYLELMVKVAPGWQDRTSSLEELGY